MVKKGEKRGHRYHPIPLRVIRGMADECSIKLGTIVQDDVDEIKKVAVYRVKVDTLPDNLPLQNISPSDLLAGLDKCFPRKEIKPTFCTWTGNTWYFYLTVLGN